MLELEEDPLPDHGNRYGWGVATPVVLTGAAMVASTRTAVRLPGRHGGLRLQGSDVTTFAITLLALAMFLHVHFFWTGTERFHFSRQLLRILAMVTGLVAFGTIIVHQIPIL